MARPMPEPDSSPRSGADPSTGPSPGPPRSGPVPLRSRHSGAEPPLLGDGEIHFLWWFIQGSIMDPEMRARLARAWGFCERHGLGYLAVDAAYRHGFLHGPAILFDDLMARALRALARSGPLAERRAHLGLRSGGPCPLCDLSMSPGSNAGAFTASLLRQGRDLTQLRQLARSGQGGWAPHVCGACAGDDRPSFCRRHLIAALDRGDVDARPNGLATVEAIAAGVATYHRACRWEDRGTDTASDRGALIAALGWCGGWEEILAWL